MFQAVSKKKTFWNQNALLKVFSIQNQKVSIHFIKATVTKHEGCQERKDDQLMSDEMGKTWRK